MLIKCFEIYKLKRVRWTVKYFFRISWIAQQIFIKLSMVFKYIFSFFSFFGFQFSHIPMQHNTGRWVSQLCGQYFHCRLPSPINNFSQIRDSWHVLILFRNIPRMFFHFVFLSSFLSFFLSFFISFSHPSQKVQQSYAWSIIVACMHRWHAKPFIRCKLIGNLFFYF